MLLVVSLAVAILSWIGFADAQLEQKPLFEALVAQLRDRDASIRKQARARLLELGDEVVPFLVQSLCDDALEDEWVERRTRRRYRPRFHFSERIARNMDGPTSLQVASFLARVLADGDLEKRVAAARAVGRMGAEGKSAAPALLVALKNPNPGLRREAACALARIGAHAEDAVPVLVEALQDPDAPRRVEAVDALAALGPAASQAAPALAALLAEPYRFRTRWGAKQWPPVHGIMAFQEEQKKRGMMDAAEEEALIRIGAPALPTLMEVFRAGDWLAREAVLRVLHGMGAAADCVIPVLAGTLDKEKAHARSYMVVITLGRLGAVPELTRWVVEDDQPYVREWAAHGLGRIGPRAKAAVPALINALEDDYYNVRHAAAEALGDIGVATAPVVEALVRRLEDEKSYVRTCATRALAEFGPKARAAIPALLKHLEDADALRALGKIGLDPAHAPTLAARLRTGAPFQAQLGEVLTGLGAAAVPLLTPLLDEENEETRALAAETLGKIGPDAAAAAPALRKRLRDTSSRVQIAAADALGRIGPGAAAAISDLDRLLLGKISRVQIAAAAALLRIEESRRGLDCLLDALDASEYELHSAAFCALFYAGACARSAVPRLLEWIHGRSGHRREEGMRLLGTIGDSAGAAVPMLIQELGGRGNQAAAEALQGIGRPAVGPLIEALEKRPKTVRLPVFELLGDLGSGAVPLLHVGLENRSPYVRQFSARALGRIGPPARAATSSLVALLLDPKEDEEVRCAVARSLGRIDVHGRAVCSALAQTLKRPKAQLREAAAEAFQHAGEGGATLAEDLVAALADKDGRVRVRAALALARIDPTEARAIQTLVEALSGPYEDAWLAWECLEKLGKPSVPVLIGLLRGDDDWHARRAAATLGRMGRAAREALPAIRAAFDHGDEDVHSAAASALIALTGPNPEKIAALARSGRRALRREAVLTLISMGKPALPALEALFEDPLFASEAIQDVDPHYYDLSWAAPLLIKLLSRGGSMTWSASRLLASCGKEAIAPVAAFIVRDVPSFARRCAIRALGQIGHRNRHLAPAVISALRPAMEDTVQEVRIAAAIELKVLDPTAEKPMPLLIEAIRASKDWYTVDQALTGLARIGPAAAAAVPLVIQELKKMQGNESHSNSALRAVIAMGPAAKDAIPHLIPLLSGPMQRSEVAEALGAIKARPDLAIPVLVELLADEEKYVRLRAAEALSKFRAAAEPAIDALKRLCHDAESDVRIAAKQSLSMISRAIKRKRGE